VISALRGRCPRPLDECAKYDSCGVELSYFTLVLPEVWRNNVYAQLFFDCVGAMQHQYLQRD